MGPRIPSRSGGCAGPGHRRGLLRASVSLLSARAITRPHEGSRARSRIWQGIRSCQPAKSPEDICTHGYRIVPPGIKSDSNGREPSSCLRPSKSFDLVYFSCIKIVLFPYLFGITQGSILPKLVIIGINYVKSQNEDI